jgi:protoheme IX farnesyltransferase
LTARRAFRALSIAAVAATYVLIAVGAVVRVSGSGLGCPDWPLCHGQFIPPPDVAAMIEFSHRLLGAVTSGLILAVCALAWATRRLEPALRWPATLVPILLVVQIGLGAVVVKLELPAMVVLVHLGFAMVILGLLTWLAAWSGPALRVTPAAGGDDTLLIPASLARLVWFTTGLVLVLILSGAFVRALGASWACVGFPTCNGQALPFGTSGLVDLHLTHRLLAYLGAWFIGLSAYLLLAPARRVPAIQRAGLAAAAAVLIQIGIGAYAVLNGVPALVQALHVAGASAVWVSVVALATLVTRVRRPGQSATASGLGSVGAPAATRRKDIAAAYFALTKPRVMVLLLITTLASMMVAAGGMPAFHLVLFTLLGGALASGGAGAINHYLDRDIDRLMERTSLRPIPAGAVTPRQALWFGIGLGALSFVLMTAFVNLLAAALSLGALLFYVFVYTRWLKRSTPSNIVIGGAAGAVPPLVGVAAVQGEITLLGLYLFAIVFFWTPPHFWALALLMRKEYEQARVPMLPIVKGDDEARRQILFYSLQLVAITLILFSLQLMGLVYLAAALLLGGLFVYYAVRLWREASASAARRLFRYSILYLMLLFVAMVVDRQIVIRV